MPKISKKNEYLLNLLKNKGLDYPDYSLIRAFSKKGKETDLNLLSKDELENIYKEWKDLETTRTKQRNIIMKHRKQKQNDKEDKDLFNYLTNEYNKNYTEETAIAEERQSKKNEKEAALSLLNLNNIGNVSNKNKTGHSTAKHKEIRNRIIRKLPVSEQDMINYEIHKQYNHDYYKSKKNNKNTPSTRKKNNNKTGHSSAKHKEIRNRIKQNLPVTEEDMNNYEKYNNYHQDYRNTYKQTKKRNIPFNSFNRHKSQKNSSKNIEPQINIQQNDTPDHVLIPKNMTENDTPDHVLIPKNMTANLFNPNEDVNEDVNEYEISKDAPINHLNLPPDFQFDEKYDFGYKDSPSVGTLIDSDKDSSSVGTLMNEDKGSNKMSNINLSSFDPTIQGYLEPLSIDNKPTEHEKHRKEAVDKFRKRKVEEKNNKEKLTKKRKRHAYSIDSLQNLNQKKTRKNKM